MARQKKGGLGKGLDALLGGPGEAPSHAPSRPTQNQQAGNQREANQAEATRQVQRLSTSEDKLAQAPAPQAVQSKNESPASSAGDSPKGLPVKKANHEPEGIQMTSDEPYSINEDKTTIKGVKQRQVAPERRTEQKKTQNDVSKEDRAQRRSSQAEQHAVDERGSAEPREIDELPLELIEPNPDQPRTLFKKEELEELSESIKKNGLLQPIVVRKAGEKYQIIAGERRWQACKLAKLEKAPVRIMEVEDDEAIILALIENIQRSDLNPIEEAYGYRRMMERGKMTQTQVAQAVSKGRSTIANALRLLELPEEAQQLLFEEKITAGHARAILSVPSTENRSKLTKKIVDDNLSVRETEALARLMSGKKEAKKSDRPQTPKTYKTVARSLSDVLEAEVRVKSSGGKNKIEILFNDEADLQRLYRLMASE